MFQPWSLTPLDKNHLLISLPTYAQSLTLSNIWLVLLSTDEALARILLFSLASFQFLLLPTLALAKEGFAPIVEATDAKHKLKFTSVNEHSDVLCQVWDFIGAPDESRQLLNCSSP